MLDDTVFKYLLAPGLAWLLAQVVKFLLVRNKDKISNEWRVLYQSGNMPSSHTATVVALAVTVGFYDGASSATFAITLILALITIYDAIMVRRSSGEQGLAIRKLLEKSIYSKDPLPFQALGHRPIEVLAGALLGAGVSLLVVFFITR